MLDFSVPLGYFHIVNNFIKLGDKFSICYMDLLITWTIIFNVFFFNH